MGVAAENALCLSVLLPTSRVEEVSFLLWNLGVLGVQELPPNDELYKPQEGTEFREPQKAEDWTKDEQLVEFASTRLKIFIPDSEKTFVDVKKLLDDQGIALLETETIIPKKYIEEYKKRIRGVEFGPGLWIGPPWADKVPSEKSFVVDPGMAFGTGEHPTTQMAVEWLHAHKGQEFLRILDLGSGSGILAIAAKRLFPSATIVATDTDLNCEEEIPKNFSLNGMSLGSVQIWCGESADLQRLIDSAQRFDLIVSNIYGEVLAKLSAQISTLLSTDGRWVATGVLDGPARQVFETTINKNFSVKKTFERRDNPPNNSHLWLCYELTK
jgi:ribosomal protein L11 methyltransferase